MFSGVSVGWLICLFVHRMTQIVMSQILMRLCRSERREPGNSIAANLDQGQIQEFIYKIFFFLHCNIKCFSNFCTNLSETKSDIFFPWQTINRCGLVCIWIRVQIMQIKIYVWTRGASMYNNKCAVYYSRFFLFRPVQQLCIILFSLGGGIDMSGLLV